MEPFFTDKIRSEAIRLTEVKYEPTYEPICITEWSSNGLPDWGSKIDLSLKTEEKVLHLEGKDFLSDVLYSGKQFIPNYQRYMVLEIEDGEARLKPCAYFRMKPQINLPNRKSSNLSSLSTREQMDEYNEKFGSKRTIKRLAEKKKFAIAFGEEDFDDMKDKTASIDIKSSVATNEATKTKADATDILNDSFLMPPRNANATSAKEVYNISDIVPENIVTSVQSSYDLEDLSKYLTSPLVKNFALHAKDNQEKVCCIFLDTLIKVKSLRSSSLKKVEYNGSLELHDSLLQQHILDNYTVTTHENRKSVRSMTEKCKDKIIIHGLILSIYLNHFKSLLISEISKVFVTSAIKMRKLGNIVGCHVDVNKAKTDKVFIFRLPLHTMDLNMYKRRRAK